MSSSNESVGFPEEILAHIFTFCDINTLFNVQQTCRRFYECVNTDIVWRVKWQELQKSLDLQGHIQPRVKQNFKDVCQRFVWIFRQPTMTTAQAVELVCPKCQSILCQSECMREREEIIVFDFGSKITYFKYASESTGQLSMHPTVGPLPIPAEDDSVLETGGTSAASGAEDIAINLSCPICAKMVKRRVCGLGDSTLDKSHKVPHCQSRIASALSKLSFRNLHCFDTSHSVDDPVLLPDTDVPLTCILQKSLPMQVHSVTPDIGASVEPGKPGTVCSAGPPSPLQEKLKIYRFLVQHMLKRNPFFQVQNIPFVMCEPTGCDHEMKINLVQYLLCDLKVPGVCFIPKAAATALYLGMDLCLVIDSGAHNTVVSPVVDQAVLNQGVVHKDIGGSHLTNQLMECLRAKGLDVEIDEASVDSSQVKRECYLAYNPTMEAKRKLPQKLLNIKGTKGECVEHQEVHLSHELYQVAEDMYLHMDLVSMVAQALSHFDMALKKRLLSNIVLTGGNNRLSGLALRLTRDLQEALPDLAAAVRVTDPRLMTGKTDALIGASYIKKWCEAHWITRNDFIVYGPRDCLTQENIV